LKIVVLIARILLGLVFFVFGLDKFHPFIPPGPLPPGAAGQFMGALFSTKYIMFVGAFETIGGLLLLINRFVPWRSHSWLR
jgi:putative oxidoreductase